MPRDSSAPSPGLRGPGVPRARARRDAGEVTWVGVLLLLVVAAGGYLGWTWGPVYVVHYEVKQVVRDYMNQAVREQNDAELVSKMTRKLASLAQVDGAEVDGSPARVPAVVVDPREITWERTTGGSPMLHVAFAYERTVTYPFLERTATKVFAVDLENDLTRPDWSTAR